MNNRNNYLSNNTMFSRHLNLTDFGLKSNDEERMLQYMKKGIKYSNHVNTLSFLKVSYNFAKSTIPTYSHQYSPKKFTQPVLFTIILYKLFKKDTYREIEEEINLSDKIKRILNIKKSPHYTTLQKYFKRVPTKILYNINTLILNHFTFKDIIVIMDGTGNTNDHADKYYANIRSKERKSYIKNHIIIDLETHLILDFQAKKGPRHDTKFAIPCLRKMKKYNVIYALGDKAYDSEEIRKFINEYLDAFDQIPLKKHPKTGHYRLNSMAIFRKVIYNQRVQVESVFSVEKRKFNGVNHSRSTSLSIKESKTKDLIFNLYRFIQLNQK